MRLVKKQQEIENAQTQLCKSLSQYCTQRIPVSLGFQGGHINCTINWSPTYGFILRKSKIGIGMLLVYQIMLQRTIQCYQLLLK